MTINTDQMDLRMEQIGNLKSGICLKERNMMNYDDFIEIMNENIDNFNNAK